MITLTFLGSNKPLVKTFGENKITSYPNIKNFNSYTESVGSLPQMRDAIAAHGRHGQCMLKGELQRELRYESRKGLSKKDEGTQYMVLDIDGFKTTAYTAGAEYTSADIIRIAETIIGQLPAVFHSVSYIVQPSSSFGIKKGSVSMHLFFMLDAIVLPSHLKTFLLGLNFATQEFRDQITLTASASALSYRIDPALADNTRLIYIGNPIFEGIEDPIRDPADRFILVQKANNLYPADTILAADEVKIRRAQNKLLRALREARGLPTKEASIQTLMVGNKNISVCTTPDRLSMQYYADNGDFVTYDVNGGDSHAYWVFKYNPAIVYNFKGEPNFLFEVADPDTYAWHREHFMNSKEAVEEVLAKKLEVPLEPLVFRDYQTDQYLNGLINPVTGAVMRMTSVSRSGIRGMEDFMAQYGAVMPENIPVWDYDFRPNENISIDYKARFLNRYQRPAIYDQIPDVDDMLSLEQLCPITHKLIWSVTGSDIQSYNHFINWFAFIVQYKEKTGTAWVFQGVQGTGKGQLFSRVLRPIIGEAYSQMMTLENVEEQFNAYLQENILLVIDEFRLKDSSNYDKLMNKIKNIITEPTINIRRMQANILSVKSHSNVMFFSNMYDVIRIEESDRRMNVAPRQETPLLTRYPELTKQLNTDLDREVPYFLAWLQHYEVNVQLAHTAMRNTAKLEMQHLTTNTIQQIADSFRQGNLQFFIEQILPRDMSDNMFVLPAKNIVSAMLRDYMPGYEWRCTNNEAHILYCAMTNSKDSQIKFSRMMGLYGLRTQSLRINGVTKNGYIINWKLEQNQVEPLRALYNANIKPITGRPLSLVGVEGHAE